MGEASLGVRLALLGSFAGGNCGRSRAELWGAANVRVALVESSDWLGELWAEPLKGRHLTRIGLEFALVRGKPNKKF